MPVYFIQAGEDGPVKIGWAKDTLARKALHQTSNPVELRVLREVECLPVDEKAFHRYFNDQRIRGEWFRFADAMLTVSVEACRIGLPAKETAHPQWAEGARKFNAWRTARGLSQPALARLLDMSVRQIGKYDRGEAEVPLTVEYALRHLAEHHTDTALRIVGATNLRF